MLVNCLIIKKRNKQKPAFSLVEIIVILFIISVGLLGALSLIIQNIQSQRINKNSIIANQLAQEGIELIRKTRDSNFLSSNPWNQDLAPGVYYIDYLDSEPQPLVSPSDARLYQVLNNFYVHDNSGQETIFFREIEIVQNSNYLDIYARINWSENNRDFNYNLQTQLYDWY